MVYWISGTNHHSNNRYDWLGLSIYRTHRSDPAIGILLRNRFHIAWIHLLRTVCLLQENVTQNK